MVRVKKLYNFRPAKEKFTLSKYKPGFLSLRYDHRKVVLKD